ncbi:MAG TPA: efflux RND transporter periplasmic adaptor subunit [Deltaproteobacteria bacterium]|nr:efflux RND transporter periplasmic adaptor subunit [Deltaproteobacteria bacterium]
MPAPLPVETASAVRAPLRVTVTEDGKTRVVDRFVISAPVAGFVRRLRLDVGDRVSRGLVVAEMEPLRPQVLDRRSRAESRARVEAARAALKAAVEKAAAAATDRDLARTEYERIERLHAGGYAPRDMLDRAGADLDRAEAALRSARFSADVARFELEAAQTALRYSAAEGDAADAGEVVTLRSPVAGSVLKVFRKSEGVVAAGQPLLEVGDTAAIEVEVDVLSEDAVRIREGMAVVIERWGGAVALEGKVRTVEPVGFTKVSALGVEEQRVLVIVEITSPRNRWERLGHGYRVEASFVLWEGSDVLQVPASALFRRGEGWACFVVEEGRARLRMVKVGHRNGLAAEILSGLRPGEIVITHPANEIDDGVAVEPSIP